MKQFIYLDIDIVNSIITQKAKGLVLETASEHEDTSGDEHGKAGNLMFNGSASGGIWKFAQAQAELSGTGKVSFNKHSQTVLKEIATKTLLSLFYSFSVSWERLLFPPHHCHPFYREWPRFLSLIVCWLYSTLLPETWAAFWNCAGAYHGNLTPPSCPHCLRLWLGGRIHCVLTGLL